MLCVKTGAELVVSENLHSRVDIYMHQDKFWVRARSLEAESVYKVRK